MPPLPISPLQGTLAGLVSCIIWSMAVLALHTIGTAFGPARATALDLGIAGTVLLVFGWARGDIRKIGLHSPRCLIICGSFWLLHFTLLMVAVSIVNSKGELLVTGLLNYLWPSLTLLLSIPILGNRANWMLLPGMLAVILGVLLGKIATAPTTAINEALAHLNVLAYSLAVLDAIAWALYSNYSRKLSNPAGSSAVPLFMITGSAILMIGSFVSGEPRAPTTYSWVVLVAWSLATALSYLLWDVGMRFGNVITISTTSMLIPLLSTIVTASISDHGLSTSLLVAAALVALGSQICRRGVV